MSKVNIVRRCSNCGSILQAERPEEEGYIESKSLLEAPLDRVLFCDKCYKEAGFSLGHESLGASEDLLTMMKDASASDSLIVYIVNTFSFEASFIKEVNEIIKGNPILVLANKRDLFKGLSSDEELEEYVAHRFRISGLPVKKEDVMLVSLAFFSDSSRLSEEIDKRRKGHDVYVISSHGAGKSAFFSSFLYNFTNNSSRAVQTSVYHGSKTPVLKIPLDASSTLYDTPALESGNDIGARIEKSVIDDLLAFSSLVDKKMTLEKGDILSLGAISFVELLEKKGDPKEEEELHLYFPPSVLLKRNKAGKGVEKTIQRVIDKKGFLPKSAAIRSIKDLSAYDIEIEERGERSIGIEGLGFFSFEGKGQTYRLYVPKGVSVYTSRSKVSINNHVSKK